MTHEELLSRIKQVLNTRTALTISEILAALNPQQTIFSEESDDTLVSRIDVQRAINSEMRDPDSTIKKTRKGRSNAYKLRSAARPDPRGKPETDTDETAAIGTGGEHLVLSELLFRGYKANIMSVDDGIDIVASKDNKIFFIQVKTTYLTNNRIHIKIPISSFDRVKPHEVRYIIVVRLDYGKARFFILHQNMASFHIHCSFVNNGSGRKNECRMHKH